jgi:hypothetical protein
MDLIDCWSAITVGLGVLSARFAAARRPRLVPAVAPATPPIRSAASGGPSPRRRG